jgi:hypothetical protein
MAPEGAQLGYARDAAVHSGTYVVGVVVLLVLLIGLAAAMER